jgi:DNA (cytosine-5)-methyltransferase 1
MVNPNLILETTYTKAISWKESDLLSRHQQEHIQTIVEYAETHKAILATLTTLLTKKIDDPTQDIRQHKVELVGGFSARVYDTSYVTPYIREKFPRLAMKSGSGWLTRSIEQLHPFTLDFPGRIRNQKVKTAFLEIIHDVQVNGANPEIYLIGLFFELIRLNEKSKIVIKRQINQNVTVQQIIQLLVEHFSVEYGVSGASRLPVIAIYSIYELLVKTSRRYKRKVLLPLKSHTTSDMKSGSIGDIEIANSNGDFFEGVEVKFGIPISLALLEDSFEKIKNHSVSRYYFLTTHDPNTLNPNEIADFIQHVYETHGCEMIVNGIIPSLKYYLRLIEKPELFLQVYDNNLIMDYEFNTDVKEIHLRMWMQLTESIR